MRREPSLTKESETELKRLKDLARLSPRPLEILALAPELFYKTDETAVRLRLKETRRAYKNKSLLVHPDRCSHPFATEAFRLIHHAYEEIVLRGWVLTKPVAGTSSGPGSPRFTFRKPAKTAEELMKDMEDWMQKKHESYFRGRPHQAQPTPPGSRTKAKRPTYEDMVNDVMEQVDQDMEDDEDDIFDHADADLVAWMRKVHRRATRDGSRGISGTSTPKLNRANSEPTPGLKRTNAQHASHSKLGKEDESEDDDDLSDDETASNGSGRNGPPQPSRKLSNHSMDEFLYANFCEPHSFGLDDTLSNLYREKDPDDQPKQQDDLDDETADDEGSPKTSGPQTPSSSSSASSQPTPDDEDFVPDWMRKMHATDRQRRRRQRKKASHLADEFSRMRTSSGHSQPGSEERLPMAC
ncbi:uncharacterized protein EV422DRAFT_564309 [Fimicolochytrium jonesii]|uniref:uncharacterized protein n=1 Tax=Fimicolochytrium jonesii TaxID=1396493 RepID=UPI0022FDB278|nr:uncharacterized protein EV422DRAFT_564309 [Fimicolochytrium jonesii]KAI8824951.1 hypothetical protein EV422DRAFT_564309 [Fimicolochytrium jonesii]